MELPKSPCPPRDLEFYQKLHNEAPAYQNNNWLMDELESICSFGAKHLLELGCGNGRFLELAAPHFDHVYGCDWAKAPGIDNLKADNVTFLKTDLSQELPDVLADLIVSADVLEHMDPATLPTILLNIDTLSTMAFHKIACYDDGLCHMTVMKPTEWLKLFQSIDPMYRLERVEKRRGIAGKEVAVITKCRPPNLQANPLKLHYGCGDVRLGGYIGVDLRECAGVDLILPAWESGPIQPKTVDEIYSRHMVEHLYLSEARAVMSMWFAILKPGGLLRVVVPDILFHARQLLGQVHSNNKDAQHNLNHAQAGFYGWHSPTRGGSEYDAHRWGYHLGTISQLIQGAGFINIKRVTSGVDGEPWHLNVTARAPGKL
jgi:SAM-dependent methyltransferase